MMMFISLVKFRKKAEAVVEFGNQLLKNLPPNVKVREIFWTLGEYDSIWIIDAPSEKEIFQMFGSPSADPMSGAKHLSE